MSWKESPNGILDSNAGANEIIQAVRRAQRLRRLAGEASWRTSDCPACGHGLKKRAFPDPYPGQTLLVCPACSWNHVIPWVMDEARLVGEEFIPGVTGRARSTAKVAVGIDARGQVVAVKGVK